MKVDWELPLALSSFLVTVAVFIGIALVVAACWGIWIALEHFFGEDGGAFAIMGIAVFLIAWANVAMAD